MQSVIRSFFTGVVFLVCLTSSGLRPLFSSTTSLVFFTQALAEDSPRKPFTNEEIVQIAQSRSQALNRLQLELDLIMRTEREYFLSLKNPGAARTIRLQPETFAAESLPQLQQRLLNFKLSIEQEIAQHASPETAIQKQLIGNEAGSTYFTRAFRIQEKKTQLLLGYFSAVFELCRIRAFARAERDHKGKRPREDLVPFHGHLLLFKCLRTSYFRYF